MSTSSTSSRVFGARSGSISLSDRINSLAVVAPSATSVHHPVPIASPNTPTTTPPSPTSSAATLEPLSLHDRRERNKAASAKYRAKKHVQSGEMRHQIQILQDQNSLISRQLEESRAENSSLKTLVEKLKNRIVAQKVLKRLRQVGRDRAPATTTSFVSVTGAASSLVPSGGARKHSRRAKASSSVRAGMAASHVAGILTDESIESVVDDYSHDSEIDELEDTLLAQDDDDDDMDVFGDDDDDDEFNLDSQMSDDSEYDNRAEQMPPMSTKRQRRSSRTSASAAKTSSTAFVAGAPPTPRRSSASSTASTASSASSSNVVHARPPLIVPDIHYE
ncbi:hypothetical protein DFQ27_003980 [Actinomortierella ambigua]|uniref:BZIP domain-containing protein n=1 Tax=Actinomortierella ambigua TaxID=1343610 RepID=A0A9P6Q337_9FUNG|nr:hypothetical protein DFQ27_003980 [Actinomortierella ambigua]